MQQVIANIIFDLDGTLVDSKRDIAGAQLWVLHQLGVDSYKLEDIYPLIGKPLAVTFAILVPCGIIMVSYLVLEFDWHKLVTLPAIPMAALLFLAVMGTALAHWFWQVGVAKIGAARAGIFLYVEPLTSTALGVAYLKEPFGMFTAIGAAFVIAGVVVAQRRSR